MSVKILWVDDEIELLKPHILFLESKEYEVETVNNGGDAVELVENNTYDIVLLDENMPGLTGLETLERVKSIDPGLPVIMITKSEEESIMEEAIGSKISDYLIKPVNPNQILLSLKKNLDTKRLVSEKTSASYQQEFRNIGMRLSDRLDTDEWMEMYEKLVFWELELDTSKDSGMDEILSMQKQEANTQFAKFVKSNYQDWVNGNGDDIPLMSHNILKEKLVPIIDKNETTFLVVIDNLRFDQYKLVNNILGEYFRTESSDLFYSILPTATQYARNALFAGLMPSEIQKMFPDKWRNDGDEGGKNMFEEDFLKANLKRNGLDIKASYNKITNLNAGKKLVDNFNNLMNNQLNVVVYNFVDMLSHARTDMEVIRELAEDDPAYRSLTISWFEHSPLYDLFKLIADKKCKVMLTTDHGTIKVQSPVKIIGDRNTNTNLRYKQGKNLNYDDRDVYEVRNPQDIYLPKSNVSSSYVFAVNDQYYVYPNNYNHFVKFYNNTFQHGGISLEEMIIPWAILSPK